MDSGLHRSATALQGWRIRLCHTHQHCSNKHDCSTTYLFIELTSLWPLIYCFHGFPQRPPSIFQIFFRSEHFVTSVVLRPSPHVFTVLSCKSIGSVSFPKSFSFQNKAITFHSYKMFSDICVIILLFISVSYSSCSLQRKYTFQLFSSRYENLICYDS